MNLSHSVKREEEAERKDVEGGEVKVGCAGWAPVGWSTQRRRRASKERQVRRQHRVDDGYSSSGSSRSASAVSSGGDNCESPRASPEVPRIRPIAQSSTGSIEDSDKGGKGESDQ